MSSKQLQTEKLFVQFNVDKVEAKFVESPQFQNWFISVSKLYNKKTEKGEIADKLQEEAWRSGGKSADDIFKLLKLDEKKEKFFESTMLGTWVSYVTMLEKFKVKSDEFVVIRYLEKKFGDMNLACMLSMEKKQNNDAMKKVITDFQRMQFKRWMAEKGMDPK
ncbi:hypothetical protein PHMEG_00016112 [Phytophthora megakarya]|uniref:RxLR effector protein n=1 Tax=Phytophthora megakarya TaxID=4795 RepID=A0A225W255_9STRA|nr:hypothetical protein PHMEG_00016112 [Phytophthora megakarya]